MTITIKKTEESTRRETVLREMLKLPSLMEAITRRKSMSKGLAQQMLNRVNDDIELFGEFKTEEGDAFAEEDPAKMAELDSVVSSLERIRDGISAKIDELGDEDVTGTMLESPVSVDAVEDLPPVMVKAAVSLAAREIEQDVSLRKAIRKFGDMDYAVAEQKISEMEPDSFTAGVVSVIASELEYEPGTQG